MTLKSNLDFKDLLDSSYQPNKMHNFNEQIIYFISRNVNLKKKKFDPGPRTNLECNSLRRLSKLT